MAVVKYPEPTQWTLNFRASLLVFFFGGDKKFSVYWADDLFLVDCHKKRPLNKSSCSIILILITVESVTQFVKQELLYINCQQNTANSSSQAWN
jgi:hypothetical protein